MLDVFFLRRDPRLCLLCWWASVYCLTFLLFVKNSYRSRRSLRSQWVHGGLGKKAKYTRNWTLLAVAQSTEGRENHSAGWLVWALHLNEWIPDFFFPDFMRSVFWLRFGKRKRFPVNISNNTKNPETLVQKNKKSRCFNRTTWKLKKTPWNKQ